ncbi:MAG: hypothetical protein GZ089_12515 [Aromatoleum sp.]|nr:hypothetical protein [Aromatoleum sp.]
MTRSCEKFLDVDAFTDQLVTTLRGGEIAIERGKVNQPGYLTLHGKVGDDGTLTLTGYAISRSKRNFGREVQASMTGSLARDPPMLTGGWGGRRCTFTLGRVSG